MRHSSFLLIICGALGYPALTGGFITPSLSGKTTAWKLEHLEQRESRHVGLPLSTCYRCEWQRSRPSRLPLSAKQNWSSDESRREEQRKILLGKRVAVAANLDAKSAWALLPEEMSDKYALKGELGRGAFGCVLLAEENGTGNRVAVKICRPQKGEMAIVMREGLAMMRIKSEHVAQLIDMGSSSLDGEVVW